MFPGLVGVFELLVLGIFASPRNESPERPIRLERFPPFPELVSQDIHPDDVTLFHAGLHWKVVSRLSSVR